MKIGTLSLVCMLLALFILAQPVCADACFKNGNDLVGLMKEHDKAEANDRDTNYPRAGEYVSYIIGVYDATRLMYNPPEGATAGQLCAIVAKFLKAHPERWAECAHILVIRALREAFPIKAK